jgi:hypothetical protein
MSRKIVRVRMYVCMYVKVPLGPMFIILNKHAHIHSHTPTYIHEKLSYTSQTHTDKHITINKPSYIHVRCTHTNVQATPSSVHGHNPQHTCMHAYARNNRHTYILE